MFTKKNIIIALTAIVILSGVVYWYKTKLIPVQKEAFEKYQKEYVAKSFSGTITNIKRYDGTDKYVDIEITDDSTHEKIQYNRLSYSFQPLLVSFMEKGDLVIKKANEETVTVVKKDGFYKSFVMY